MCRLGTHTTRMSQQSSGWRLLRSQSSRERARKRSALVAKLRGVLNSRAYVLSCLTARMALVRTQLWPLIYEFGYWSTG